MRSPLLPAALVAAALALSACSATPSSGVVAQQQPVAPAPVASAPALAVPTQTASPQDSPSPSAAPSPTRPPAPTYDVRAVQRQLTALHYYVGGVDGERGPAFASAVTAFQKVQGIGADGIVGKGTLAALKGPRSPVLKGSSPADRVEVDLTRQVLYVVKAGAVSRILPVSSGNGATYLQKNGQPAKALSPVGWYTISRRILGAHKADLGTLYDPQYFYRGWAIHGSNSVPAYPASHGCIRVTRTDALYLLDVIGVGTPVYVYGGRYTFTAGSAAPGTDNPTGDTPIGPPASPSPSPSGRPAGSPSAGPSAAPSPSAAPPKAAASPVPPPSPAASPKPSPTP